MIFTKEFLLDLAERAIVTFAQAFAASLVVTGLNDVKTALAIAAGAGILAVAKALAASQIGTKGNASLTV